MAISFIQHMRDRKMTSFKFVDVKKVATTRKVDEDGNEIPASFYVEFTLEDILEYVESKTKKYYGENGERLPSNVLENVTKVKMYEDVCERHTSEFTYVEHDDGRTSGSYNGDCFFDVSEGDDVWLTDELLSEYGRKKRQKSRDQKVHNIAAMMANRAAKLSKR